MEDQRILHYFISTIGNFQQCSTPAQVVQPINNVSTPVEDPLASNYGQPENQTNLLVQIAEVTGDDSVLQAQYPVTPEGAFTNTAEVMEQAMKDELVFGVSGVAVSADGLRNVPIEEVLAVMKAEDSIPESIENKTVAIDIPEGTEIVEKEVLMSAEVVVMDLGDPESTPEPLQDYIERTAVEEVDHVVVENEIWTTEDEPQKIATILDETVHYTDPVGNTFEAPVVIDDLVTEENLEEEIRETEVENFFEETTPSLEPSPKDYAIFESEQVNGTYALYDTNEDQVNLDLKQPEVQLINEEANLNEFDLDFASDDAEEEGPDNTPDFF
jgi:hypothetical protein